MILPFKGQAPDIDRAVFVAKNATVAGRVTLDEDVSIWFGAVVRGDYSTVTVGRGTNVQDNAVIHNDIGHPAVIGCGVTIGHGAVVHGCTVGDHCLIGMHATLLNGCEIGENCIVAAGALVLENARIPAGSLVVGAPAKELRPLSAEQLAFLPESASSYLEHAKDYAAAQAAAE